MDADSPFEGDVPDGGDEPSYEWLDEWLCEYVDGTMDPSLEVVFEKYVEANPELKAHVERLQETRELLCNCGPPKEPPPEVEAEVCWEVEHDLLRSSASVSETMQNRPVAALGLVSSVAAALVIGFLVGAMVVGPTPSSPYAPPQTAGETESVPSTLHRTQATDGERPPFRPRRAAPPFVATDSAQSPPTLTTTGMP
jgi:hypothetical protein